MTINSPDSAIESEVQSEDIDPRLSHQAQDWSFYAVGDDPPDRVFRQPAGGRDPAHLKQGCVGGYVWVETARRRRHEIDRNGGAWILDLERLGLSADPVDEGLIRRSEVRGT